jgi:hypothetical protein
VTISAALPPMATVRSVRIALQRETNSVAKHLVVLIAASRTEVIGRQLRNVSRLLVEADSVFRLLPREEF